MAFLHSQLTSRRDFEVMQAYLNRFLVVYGDTIALRKPLREQLEQLLQAQKASWGGLQELLQHNMCLLQFMADVR